MEEQNDDLRETEGGVPIKTWTRGVPVEPEAIEQHDLVEIAHTLKQVLCVKGWQGIRDPVDRKGGYWGGEPDAARRGFAGLRRIAVVIAKDSKNSVIHGVRPEAG